VWNIEFARFDELAFGVDDSRIFMVLMIQELGLGFGDN